MTDALQELGDRYEIERILGRGGMAVVHLAEERKHQRKVAIKILREDIGVSVGAERFLREIGIAARLSHPHIVPLIDSGQVQGQLVLCIAVCSRRIASRSPRPGEETSPG